jgi:hypothetical protein
MGGGIRKIKAIRRGAYYYSLVLNAQPCKYDMYKSSLRHILVHDPVLSSLKMKGIRSFPLGFVTRIVFGEKCRSWLLKIKSVDLPEFWHGYVLREEGTHCILLIAHVALCKARLTPAHCISLIVYLTPYTLHLTPYTLHLTPYTLGLTS